jgi:ribonuclease HII
VKKFKYLVGVDEAGRGPLAGPVAVGVVVVPFDFDFDCIPGVGDSKKVSPKNREAIFRRARQLQKEKGLNFAVVLVSSAYIDKKGIAHAVTSGIEKGFQKLNLDPRSTEVRLDGLLHAPAIFKKQQTIIKGDAQEKVIGLASILAKVTRDRYLVQIAKKYPAFGFEIHKGYGTLMHRHAIKRYGLSKIHRRSFCQNIHK